MAFPQSNVVIPTLGVGVGASHQTPLVITRSASGNNAQAGQEHRHYCRRIGYAPHVAAT